MNLKIIPTTQFRKDLKRIRKRRYDISLLDDIIKKLSHSEPLPPQNHDHELTGDYTGFRECHILPDWLLIYSIDKNHLILILSRTGTHSDLF